MKMYQLAVSCFLIKVRFDGATWKAWVDHTSLSGHWETRAYTTKKRLVAWFQREFPSDVWQPVETLLNS